MSGCAHVVLQFALQWVECGPPFLPSISICLLQWGAPASAYPSPQPSLWSSACPTLGHLLGSGETPGLEQNRAMEVWMPPTPIGLSKCMISSMKPRRPTAILWLSFQFSALFCIHSDLFILLLESVLWPSTVSYNIIYLIKIFWFPRPYEVMHTIFLHFSFVFLHGNSDFPYS